MNSKLDMPLTDLTVSIRVRRGLQRLNLITVRELTQCTDADLLSVRNFGLCSLWEVKARLAELGLELRKTK